MYIDYIETDFAEILFTREQIRQRVEELGQKITEDYDGKRPILVCILKGAGVFMADLIREIPTPINIDFMVVSSYGSGTESSGVVNYPPLRHCLEAGASCEVSIPNGSSY